MKKVLLKAIIIGMINLVLITILVACRTIQDRGRENESISWKERNSNTSELIEVSENNPFIIFYDGDAHIIENFIYQYPEINIKTYNIPSGAYEYGMIESWIELYGEPDIILTQNFGYGYNVRIENWYREGNIANIGEFLSKDTSIDESDYVQGTFDVLYTGKELLGLPLSWEKACVVIRNSKLEESELIYLADDYTGEELYSALMHEIKKGVNEEEFFFAYAYGMLEGLFELCVIELDNGEIYIEEEIFELLYNFFAIREVVDYETRYQYMNHPALDPRVFDGKYFACMIEGAPQITSIYAKSAAQLFGEDIQLFWIPKMESGTEYIGKVVDVALLGGKSVRKQQAYELIRIMMDMPIEIIHQPFLIDYPKTSSPVNINRAIELLDYFESYDGEIILKSFSGSVLYTVEQKKLDEEEKNQIYNLIKGVTELHFDIDNQEVYSIYNNYKEAIIEGKYVDYKPCYNEILKALKSKNE